MRFYISNGESEKIINLEEFKKENQNSFRLMIDGKEVSVRRIGEKFFYSLDQRKWQLLAIVDFDEITSNINSYKLYRGFKPSSLFSGNSGDLVTQMPGKVVKLLCKEGQKVKAGETLLILEAMKMENEIKTGRDGVVKKVHIKESQSLEAGSLMIELTE